jgi:hypothetical protein
MGVFWRGVGTYHPLLAIVPVDHGQIRAGKRIDGSTSYTAQIRLFRDGAQVYQESQTFARKEAARAWVLNRE